MKKIWKFRLPVTSCSFVSMPKGAIVLSTYVQHGGIQVWALVDPKAPLEPREFRIVGTGHPLEDDIVSMQFIGTVQMGAFVWHIFVHPEGED